MIPKYLVGKQLPRHMQIAYSLIGTTEIEGPKHNIIILGWAKDLGLGKAYFSDETAWCGLFFAHVMKEAGRRVDLSTKDPFDYLRALKYANMPNVTKIQPEDAKFGDILIFQRPSGGHIGFLDHVTKDSFGTLGGNQGNKVSIVNISKTRCKYVLRPNYISYIPFDMVLNSNSTKLSQNEA